LRQTPAAPRSTPACASRWWAGMSRLSAID
jgi:hypothetical protein